MVAVSLAAIRKITSGGFNPLKNQYVHREDVQFIAHLVLTAISVLAMTAVMTTSWWIIFTRWNSINGALAFVSFNLIPTTLLVASVFPRNQLPSIWVVGLGVSSSFFSFLVNLAFVIIFTAAAWGTGVWENETMTLIYENAQGLMLAIWFFASTFNIVALFTYFVFWCMYIPSYIYEVSPAGFANRVGMGFFKRILSTSPAIA